MEIGQINICCLQSLDTVEIFKMTSIEVGVGPGLHLHRAMEESFYVIEGQIGLMLNGQRRALQKGDSCSVPRNTPHSWKTETKNTAMLIIFSPAQNQRGYFSELEKCHRQNVSWQEAITMLATRFDNIPLDIVKKI